MGVLIGTAAIALLLGGCYQPELQDCTVTCAAVDECADGQVCAGGWCVAADRACDELADAGIAADAGLAVDAEALVPDAPPSVALHLVVEGRGKIVVEPLGVECVGVNNVAGDCTFDAPDGSTQTLLPVALHDEFRGWTTDTCRDVPGECTLTMAGTVMLVGAAFD